MGASWQAFYAHLCAASIIRAMPETEIPPAMRGDLYFPDIPQIIAYMLKLTSISCFSIVMPIYIDNLMIIGYLITIRRGLCMKEINSFG